MTQLPKTSPSKTSAIITRRQLLRWGMGGAGLVGSFWGMQHLAEGRFSSPPPPLIPPLPKDLPTYGNSLNSLQIVRDFDSGIVKQDKGRNIREFHAKASSTTLQLNSAISFVSWNINGRVPGPTLRAREGDWIRVIFHNADGHSHSMHFHGIHPATMDGVKPVRSGKTVIYEFEAKPYGVHLYHCHIAPVTRHIGKGLYGMFIVDPPQARSPADELVLVMGGYDLNDDQHNELYAFNAIPNYFRDHPIPIYQKQLIRLYVLNMIEFDPVATFHIHANLFKVYRTGRSLTPDEETDVITMGTTERHILEFAYDYPGLYMFHPHQDIMAENGCMGHFNVISSP
jgi:FtsP/CotA-like multicopper oxidase with cupredoxin domain